MRYGNKPTPEYLKLMESFKNQENGDSAILEGAGITGYNETQNLANEMHKKQKDKLSIAREFSEFKNKLENSLLEAAFNKILDMSMGNANSILDPASKEFCNSIVSSYVEEQTGSALLEKMSTRSILLSEMANRINEIVSSVLENVDPEDPSTYNVSASEEDDLLDDIDGSEEIEDITDIIRERVSRATEEFITKNRADNSEIQNMIEDTKERIQDINTGDEDIDSQAAQQENARLQKKIKTIKVSSATSIFGLVVENFAKTVIGNSDLLKVYTSESGKLNMDLVVEQAGCYYTLLEALNTLQLEEANEAYLKEAVIIK